MLVRMLGKTDALKQLQTLLGGFGLAAAQHLDLRDGQVFDNAQVREQFEVLKHHADPRAQLGQVGLRIGDRCAVDNDIAFLKRFQCVHAFDQGRFAGAGRAAHHNYFALADLGAAIGQYLEVPIPLVDVFDGNHTANLFCRRFTTSEAAKLIVKYTRPAMIRNSLARPMMSPLERDALRKSTRPTVYTREVS